jgi:cyclic pyranopterin phosphate synthase
MNDVGVPVARVVEGIDAALAAGLRPVKLNAVIRRGVNDAGVLDLARFARERGCTLRFIEFMDVGTTNGWRLEEVVPAAELVARIDAEMPLEPAAASYRGEVAGRHRYRDGGGEVGMIASVTQPFCADCTRARLSADGRLYTCLFAGDGHDLRGPLRAGATDPELASLVAEIWGGRRDRYSEARSELTSGLRRVEMSFIGG